LRSEAGEGGRERSPLSPPPDPSLPPSTFLALRDDKERQALFASGERVLDLPAAAALAGAVSSVISVLLETTLMRSRLSFAVPALRCSS
jgi:hypothetical protein